MKPKGWTGDRYQHGMASKGVKTKRLEKRMIRDIQNPLSVPYASDVRFYADKKTKKIIVVKTKHLGKGWIEYRVGDYLRKSRDIMEDLRMLKKYYPDYIKISLFTETNFHSSITKPKQITNYGMTDYTLQYSDYTPLETYSIEQPVRTGRRDMNSEIIDKITTQQWNYVVLNWIPEDPIKLQISHKTSTPFDEETPIFKSRIYDISERKQAIADFKNYVKKLR